MMIAKRAAPCNPPLPHGYVPKAKLYKHQIEGIEALEKYCYFGLFDQMGLGKTLELLYTALDMIHGKVFECAIIVCKASHARVWTEHIDMHAPGTPYYSVIGMAPGKRKQAWPLNFPIYLVNYELLSRMIVTKKRAQEAITKGHPIYTLQNGVRIVGEDATNLHTLMNNKQCALILDESQMIKNPTAKVTRVLHGLAPKAVCRYIATGTPVAERPDDTWSQIFFLDRGRLLGNNYWKFIHNYAKFYEARGRRWITGYKNLGDLRARIQSISIRRTKDECLDLPQKMFEHEYTTPGAQQAQLLGAVRTEMIQALASMKKGRIQLQVGTSFSSCLQRLQKVAAMPCTVHPNCKPSAKYDALRYHMEAMNGDQIVVWCIHKAVVDAVTLRLNMELTPYTAVKVHGDISIGERNNTIDAFKAGKHRALVATMATLREAVTLTCAQHAFYMQLDFSLVNWLQSQDRIHRIGTKGTVVVNTPLLLGSLDSYIHTYLLDKEAHATSSTDHNVVTVSRDGLLKTLKKGK